MIVIINIIIAGGSETVPETGSRPARYRIPFLPKTFPDKVSRMHTPPPPAIRFSLLCLALSAGFAHADAELPSIEVAGEKSLTTGNYRNIAERNVSSIRDVLADRADINVGGGGLSAQYLSIRAAGQNKIDLVVDNTGTATQIWYHQGRFQLDPAMIKVIGVEKGAGSASAGIGATSGAVRARTVEAEDFLKEGQTVGARVGAEFNSNKGLGGNLALYGRSNGFDGLLMGSWLNERNYRGGRGYRDGTSQSSLTTNTARNQANYLAKLGYRFNEDHKIGISYRHERYYGVGADRFEFAWDDRTGPTESLQKTLNLDYQGRNLGFIRDVEANLFRLKLEDNRNAWAGSVDLGGGRHSETLTQGGNVNFTSELPGNHLLKYGFNVRSESTNSQDRRSGYVDGERKREYGLYVEGIWSLSPLTLSTGLRYDHFRLQTAGNPNRAGNRRAADGHLSPSLGLTWDINPNWTLNAKWNYAVRSPQLASANTLTDTRGSASQARGLRNVNPNLKLERARLAEIGLRWQQGGWSVSGSVFHQTVRNYYSVNNSQNDLTNRGTVRTGGYELEAAYRHNGLTARLGTAYANPKADFPISNDPLDILPQGRRWVAGLSYTFDRANLEIGWRGRFAQSKTYTVAGGRSGPPTATMHRQGYGVHDLYMNWKPAGEDLNVNFAINNIGNKRYYSHSQRVTDIAPPARGREVRLGVNYRF